MLLEGNPLIDTWRKSGPQVVGRLPTWKYENLPWISERIGRGDSFGIATDPATLPPLSGGFQSGVANGYFTRRELHLLDSLDITPVWMGE
jgi:hypothetical protein